jgi:predicted transcriptional regulator
MNAILSIKPQFVDEIIAGRKRFEFRKHGFKKPVRNIYIYASSPVCRIIGEFELGAIIEDKPEELWNRTRDYSGISKAFFDEYFSAHDVGYALEIKTFKKYSEPINPYKQNREFRAPQSFRYVESGKMI